MSDTCGMCACGHSEADHEFDEEGVPRACQNCLGCTRYDEVVSPR